ncbi:hypothetical protein [Streptomyces syringium]|uniref:hypothetical protein n=1 Tax=Streptomyces syringium TaxID=76729 RepID=UPI00342C0E00
MRRTGEDSPALRFEPADDPLGTLAFRRLTDRAHEAYGIALHYQPAEDEEAATREAMSHALLSVSFGFAAAAPERIATDPSWA